MHALTAKELVVLIEVDHRPGASEQILAEALEIGHIELTFYLSTLIAQHLIEYDEVGQYGARLYRSSPAGRRRVVNGTQLELAHEPYTSGQARRGTRRLLHDVLSPKSNF